MKRKNYYSIHKNKKIKVNTKIKVTPVEAVLKFTEALNKFVDAWKEIKMPIPQYKKGGILNKDLQIVSDNSKPEIITKPN